MPPPILILGFEWPRLRNMPLEHIGPNVPVVTTSTISAAPFVPFSSTMSAISSAVTTTAAPFFIFSLISAIVFKAPPSCDYGMDGLECPFIGAAHYP